MIGINEFKNDKETWLYVMYVGKDRNTTEGWMLEKHPNVPGGITP